MKNLLTIVSLFIVTIAMAQTPQGFNYQAIIRSSTGAVVANQQVSLKFNIIHGQPTNTATYVEQHTATTDDLGTVNLVVGQGTPTSGIFQQIDWSLGSYHLGIEVNIGEGFVVMGTTQLLSVPYALYAERSGASSTDVIYLGKLTYIPEQQAITAHYLVPSFQDDYDFAGYALSTTPNPTTLSSFYTDELNYNNEFRFNRDLYTDVPEGTPAGTTIYVRAWIRKIDGTYVYSQQRTIVTQ